MENFELTIAAPPKRADGRFQKGQKPFNKGVPMSQWMDGRKMRKVLKYLEIGRKAGNKHLAGSNKIGIVAIKDNRLRAFSSAMDAVKILRTEGVKINARNIRAVCNQTPVKNNGYWYIRKKAGGYEWFNADDYGRYKEKLTA
jgi:hypothetical protein